MTVTTFDTNGLVDYLNGTVSKGIIYKLVREDKIPYFKMGTRILFRKESIDNWVSEQERRKSC